MYHTGGGAAGIAASGGLATTGYNALALLVGAVSCVLLGVSLTAAFRKVPS